MRSPDLIPLTGDLAPVAFILAELKAAGARPLLVGGCVRDALRGHAPKDIDIEVFGLDAPRMEAVVSRVAKVDTVGRAFGVLKVKGLEVDIAMPRRETKSGTGHTGFVVEGDPFLPLDCAAARRDFTINALYYDPFAGEVLDPANGLADLNARVLRHTSEHFAEDPLRVLRAMQFAARFGFSVAPETVALCAGIGPEGLPRERIFGEVSKLILKGEKPSHGLQFLHDCGWVNLFPELAALRGVQQDPEWHPEGDAWTHTLHCMDAFAAHRTGDEREDLVVGLAVLCHDLGKPSTTRLESDGRWHAYGHEEAGVPFALSFLRRLTEDRELLSAIPPLVANHMRPHALHKDGAGSAAIRRLANEVGRIDRLIRVVEADYRGRPPKTVERIPACEWLAARAEELSVSKEPTKPLIQGRHLITLGLAPGREFSAHLKAAFEAQVEGVFTSEADGLKWISSRLKIKSQRI